MPPANVADAHRPWLGTAEQLARIGSLHQRPSGQLSGSFSGPPEGDIVQLEPGLSHAPSSRAVVDMAQYADGHIEGLYRGQSLRHRRFTVHAHLKADTVADDKQTNDRVGSAPHRQRSAWGRLLVTIEHQDAQRAMGIRTPSSGAHEPLLRGFRPRPEPSHP